jgi:hypothetical protein
MHLSDVFTNADEALALSHAQMAERVLLKNSKVVEDSRITRGNCHHGPRFMFSDSMLVPNGRIGVSLCYSLGKSLGPGCSARSY